jgi:hypothetical protein
MLPHLLHDAGVSVTAFSPWHLKLNPYVREHLAGAREAAEAAIQLCDLMSRRRFDWVIIADDYLLQAVVERSDFAAPPSWLPFDPRSDNARRLLLSKHGFAKSASQLGIPVPQSHLASSAQEVAMYAKRLGFPVVVKGVHGSAGDVVYVATDASALRRASAKLLLAGKHVLVQRFVNGPLAAAYALYDRGEVVGYSTHLLECPFPLNVSAPTVRSRFAHPTFDLVVRAIGAATCFHGLAGIDFVQDEKTGELYALEVNPRPTAGFSDGPATRAFFAPLVADFLEGKPPRGLVFDAPTSAQFPAYIFYFLMRADKRSAQSYRHALDSLAKVRPDNAALAVWQIARFTKDHVWGMLGFKAIGGFLKGILVSILGPAVWLACKILQYALDQTDLYIESVTRVAR